MRDIPFDSDLYIPGKSEFSVQEGEDQTEELLSRGSDVDAIIFHDDYRAIGGIRALRKAGINVPEDIAVAGFHDYEIAQYSAPQLTTVHVRMREMGEIAARRLYSLMEMPDQSPWFITVPTYLVVREST